MDISVNDSDQKIMFNTGRNFNNIRNLSDREAKWIRHRLINTENIKFIKVPMIGVQEGLVRELIKYEGFEEVVDKVLSDMATHLIPEREFEWLLGDLRAQIFSKNILFTENRANKVKEYYGYKTIDLIYSFFDFAREGNKYVDFGDKLALMKDIKIRFDKVFYKNNYAEWLDEKDVKQIEWTQNYLTDIEIYQPTVVDKLDCNEMRAVVLASLDLIDTVPKGDGNVAYVQSDRKERIIDKMKRAWSQQKYRDAGKTKKHYHLPLTKIANARLDKMASVQDAKPSDILDMLINTAYETDYIDKNGKDKY